jgi:hypothetical protein
MSILGSFIVRFMTLIYRTRQAPNAEARALRKNRVFKQYEPVKAFSLDVGTVRSRSFAISGCPARQYLQSYAAAC